MSRGSPSQPNFGPARRKSCAGRTVRQVMLSPNGGGSLSGASPKRGRRNRHEGRKLIGNRRCWPDRCLAAVAATPAAASTVWAVGDGANASSNDDAVVNLIAAEPADRLLYLGDVYETGTAAEFANYYAADLRAPQDDHQADARQPRVGQPRQAATTPTGARPTRSRTTTRSTATAGTSISLNSEEPMGEGRLSWPGCGPGPRRRTRAAARSPTGTGRATRPAATATRPTPIRSGGRWPATPASC